MENKAKEIVSYLRAGFSTFWIPTAEPMRLESYIQPIIEDFESKAGDKWNVKSWRCTIDNGTPEDKDPVKFLNKLSNDDSPEGTVFFLHNFNWFIEKNKLLVQIIQDQSPVWASQGKAIVVISQSASIPVELQKFFCLLKLDLPNEEEIIKSVEKISSAIPNAKPDKKCLPKIVNAAKGLTLNEIENVFSLSLVEKSAIAPEVINSYKAQMIAKTGFLEVIPPTRNFSSIIGYDSWKQFTLETGRDPRSKGSLLIGHPGTGKTMLLYGTAGEFPDKSTVKLVIGKLFSKFVGETDANVDYVIDFLTAIGNCNLIIDEFEKQFSGVGGSDDGTGGTTIRANSRWLDFLQFRPPGINVYGTANSVRGIPPEYLRAGRWDVAPFFVGLPSDNVKGEILNHYLKINEMKKPAASLIPKMEKWAGCDIEACCNLASMRSISLIEASKFIRPQALTMKREIDELESWAKDRCIPAEDAPVSTPIKRRKLAI